MNTYFKNVNTLEELRKQYKELLKQHHPDNGGEVAIMQEINAEYDRLFKILKNQHESNKSEEKESSYSNVNTLEELRKQYKELLKQHHPDNGGEVAIMQEINAEYDRLFKILKNQHESNKSEEKESSYNNMKYDFSEDEKLRDILNKVIH